MLEIVEAFLVHLQANKFYLFQMPYNETEPTSLPSEIVVAERLCLVAR